ncbi:ROK family protein [Erwinia sp. 9145]|uniref:ROK family protein n=1 Tax=Erwinia sp. 9145 TaxID=1500895 RepID=UPI00054F37E6|nr:ROK family protein [Erwinia sp. 9145]
MKESGKGPALLRVHNVKRALGFLRQQRITTRQDMSQALSLSKNTVSLIVEELIAADLVQERGLQQVAGAGRPKIQIALRPEKMKAAGILIERERAQLTVCDYFSEVIDTRTWPMDTQDPQRVLREINALCRQLVAQHPELLGIGVGLPGIIDPERGYLHLSSHLNWHSVDVQSALRDVGAPVRVMNPVRAAALLSLPRHNEGAARSCFYLRVGEGTGGALLNGNEIFTGSSWTAGEAGHLTVADGPQCRCGQQGCLEAIISIPAIRQRFARARAGLSWEKRDEAPDVTHAIMREAGEALGKALSQIMLLLNPATLVIDCPWNISPTFCEYARETARARTLAFTFKHTSINFLTDNYSPTRGLALAIITRNEATTI